MEVTLYMAQTVNGYIADAKEKTPWSKEEWRAFYRELKARKHLIIGRRTYEAMLSIPDESKWLSGVTAVVVTKSNLKAKKNVIFVKSPRAALKVLKAKGFSNILLSGGGKLNRSFLEQGLVDKIRLDIEARVFGAGIPLFDSCKFNAKLKLLNVKHLSKDLIQLNYKVLKG